MKKIYPVYIIMVLALSLICTEITAQAQIYSRFVDVNVIPQEMSNWCWAASTQALIRQRTGILISQEIIVILAKGSAVNEAGLPTEVKEVCGLLGITVFADMFSPQPPGRTEIVNWINQNKSFILWRSNSAGMNLRFDPDDWEIQSTNHCTVGFGYLIYRYYHNLYITWVAIDDPAPGRGKSWYSLDALQTGWFATVH